MTSSRGRRGVGTAVRLDFSVCTSHSDMIYLLLNSEFLRGQVYNLNGFQSFHLMLSFLVSTGQSDIVFFMLESNVT